MIVDNIKFSNFKEQPFGTSIGFSDNYIIKIENFHHQFKLNSLEKEAEIIKRLNSLNCVCVPKLISSGKLTNNKKYLILERIHQKDGGNNTDTLFSFLALRVCGVIHGDMKKKNKIFNGLYDVMIDFDQAFVDEQFVQPEN